MQRYPRRRFLVRSGIGFAAAVVAALNLPRGHEAPEWAPEPAGGSTPAPRVATPDLPQSTPPPSPSPTSIPSPTPTATPSPPPPTPAPAVRTEIQFMEGTPHAARVTLWESQRPGPTVIVLGGVHGDEPAGWGAAEVIADWETAAGTLIVAPRVNHLAAVSGVRTTDQLGDANRLYPGDPGGLPMARMALEVTELARAVAPAYLFDLHESWTFYPQALGQTVAVNGSDETLAVVRAAVESTNHQLTERERFSFHNRQGHTSAWSGEVNSSISLGEFVPGCVAVLLETAQEGQALARREEMHRIVVASALEHLGMV